MRNSAAGERSYKHLFAIRRSSGRRTAVRLHAREVTTNLVTQIAAGLYAVILVAVGTLEIFFHGDQRFRSIFYVEPGTEGAVRMWAMNVGMYNILTALGIGAGIWLGNSGSEARAAGIGIVIVALAAHLILGPWLWVTEHRLWMSAIGQASLPLIGIVAFLVAG